MGVNLSVMIGCFASPIVYYDQRLCVGHSKRWSKSALLTFSHGFDAKMTKNEAKMSVFFENLIIRPVFHR